MAEDAKSLCSAVRKYLVRKYPLLQEGQFDLKPTDSWKKITRSDDLDFDDFLQIQGLTAGDGGSIQYSLPIPDLMSKRILVELEFHAKIFVEIRAGVHEIISLKPEATVLELTQMLQAGTGQVFVKDRELGDSQKIFDSVDKSTSGGIPKVKFVADSLDVQIKALLSEEEEQRTRKQREENHERELAALVG